MSRQRLMTVVSLLAVLVGGLLAGPAQAHDNYHRVNLSGSIYTLDDDLWPNPDDSGTHIFSGSVRVGPNVFSQSFSTSDCVGGEVYSTLSVIVEDQAGGWIKARARGRVFEYENCPNGDLDGDSGEKTVWVPLGSERTITFRVHNGEPGDYGYTDYRLTVQNRPA